MEDTGVTLFGCWAHAKRKFNEALVTCGSKSADAPEAIGRGILYMGDPAGRQNLDSKSFGQGTYVCQKSEKIPARLFGGRAY